MAETYRASPIGSAPNKAPVYIQISKARQWVMHMQRASGEFQNGQGAKAPA
jgi:hypothetical protein